MRTSASITDSAELAARALLRMVLARLGPREFAVQLWDGEHWPPEPEGPADFKLIFRSPNVVRSMFSDISSLSLGEAYIYGHLDCRRFFDRCVRVRRSVVDDPLSCR